MLPFANEAFHSLNPKKNDKANPFMSFPDFPWEIDPELVFETYIWWGRSNFQWPPPPMRDIHSVVNRQELNHLNAAHAVVEWIKNEAKKKTPHE